MPLNARRQRFVQEYRKTGNAAEAARRAGYSEKTARTIGQKLLTNIDVMAAIQEDSAKIAEATDTGQAWTLKELRRVYERCMEDVPVLDKEGEPIGVYTFQSAQALKALELIGRSQGLYTDRIEHGGNVEIVVSVPEGECKDKRSR